MEPIAIIGVAQTRYQGAVEDKTCYDLVYEVTRDAIEDAGLTLRDIANVVTVSNDFLDGRTISSMAVGDAAGGHDKNISTVEGDGTFGAFYGAMRVLGGFESTLVVAHGKGSEGSPHLITNAMFDPVFQRLLGIDALTAAALQANVYMARHGLCEEDFARVSVKNHANARNNPFAHRAMDLTLEEVMASKRLADPIKELDCSPVSDGAAAIVLASKDLAGRGRHPPVWVKGVAHATDAYFLGDRDLADPASLRDAATRAFRMAGVRDPSKEIHVVELYDAFSYMEPLWLEGMGFCGPGMGPRLLRDRVTTMEGAMPVNPSGGVLSAHAPLAAGLSRIVEAVLQLRGEAGARQVRGAGTALAHGINGPCGQSHCVWILGKER